MSLSSPTRHAFARDILGNSIVVLETMREVSSAIPAIPLLGAVLGTAISLIRTMEKVQDAHERSIRLGKRAADLISHVHDAVARDLEGADESIITNLRSLTETLTVIRDDIEKLRKKKWFTRFLRHQSLSDSLDMHVETLDYAWRSFDTCCLITLRQRLERQSKHSEELIARVGELTHHTQRSSMYDDQQLRLFRWHEVRLDRPRGLWHLRDTANGTEHEGEWSGRAIAIRLLHPDSTCQDPADCVKHMSRIRHPFIAQIFGYSHPLTPEKFYVLEIGSRTLRACLDIPDLKRRLRMWIQTLADYDSAIRYAMSLGLPWMDPFIPRGSLTDLSSWQCRWLSSASLRDNWNLIITIEDLVDHGPYGMINLWSLLYNDDTAWIRPSTNPMNIQDNIRDLFKALLDDENQPAIDWKLWRSRGDLVFIDDASLGDYGYVQYAQGGMKNFVRLGHIKDLVINNPRYSEGILEFPVMAPGKTSIPIIIARGNVHECLIFSHLVSVKDWCMRIYWEKLLEIAELHRIPIHDMAIVHEMDFKAQLSVLNECSAKSCALVSLPSEDAGIQVLADQGILPSLQRFQCGSCIKNMDVQGDDSGVYPPIFFHIARDEDPTEIRQRAWGFWSRVADPYPGPHPKIDVPGVRSECFTSYVYARLPRPVSDFFRFCHQRQKPTRWRSQLQSSVFSDEMEEVLREISERHSLSWDGAARW